MNEVLNLQERAVDADNATRGSNWSWWACGENQPESSVSFFGCAGG
jgi:hypothetical protein